MHPFIKKLLFVFLISHVSVLAWGQVKTIKNKQDIESKKAAAQKVDTTRFTPPKIVKDEDVPPPMEQLNPLIDFDTTAAPDDAFTKDIRTLLNTMGALRTDIEVAQQALATSFKGQENEMTKEFSKRFVTEMKEGRANRWLENLYIRTYRSAYTQKDIQELNQFYKTPLGQKVVTTMPSLMTSVMSNSQKIGKYLGQKIMTEILAEQNK